MKIKANRDDLLGPLTQIGGVVERRQTLPILANVLLNAKSDQLTITATDLEVELKTNAVAQCDEELDFTLPARKLIDICKALPEGSSITIQVENEKAVLRSGRGRFSLGILPAIDYPAIEPSAIKETITLNQKVFKRLLEKTQFAMAQQDVRYYLNGLLLEVKGGILKTVATDGHRLAMSEVDGIADPELDIQVIIPRKAVIELIRLLNDSDDEIKIDLSSNHVRFHIGETLFTSKLIDAKFPDYQRVMPENADKRMVANKDLLKQSLQRASILSNEKYRGIRFKLGNNLLQLQAHNPEQEEAEEEVEIEFNEDEIAIGFNVGYVLDVIGSLTGDEIVMMLKDSNSSVMVSEEGLTKEHYVIMPMRL
jgi:DNA polymerase-3 subunit beta